jgi:glycosyltransferase involved in cell wall biosynthesis/GT2 family glycosyltransferase
MNHVSIVVSCYNPRYFLLEAIASARAQTSCAVEVILVNDGTNRREGHEVLEKARALADRYIERPNGGLASARNAGFRAASCEYVIPLDADDLLDRRFAATCLEALAEHPEAAFAYADYRVFGTRNYVERLRDYNLYELLDRNTLPYAAAIRRGEWRDAGGYDESMSGGYEDWEFWLRLGERGRYGQHVSRVLLRYRKHAPSLFDTAGARHGELLQYIQQKHPGLYGDEARARIKSRWSPAVCIAAMEGRMERQTIHDWAAVAGADDDAVGRSSAFLVPGKAQRLRPESGELAALAVWGGRQHLELPDGSVALSREAFLNGTARPGPRSPQRHTAIPRPLESLWRHLSNAGLLSLRAWTLHPVRSAGRLIPLRLKERANRVSGRQLFDLTFYLQFRPAAIQVAAAVHQPLCYIPETPSRKRIAFVTPHLGPGGAESVLLDIAAALDRSRYELFLLATQSHNNGWRKRWEEAVDHVYDLQELVGFDKAGAAIYSIAVNWQVETLLVQNSLTGYGILPHLKARIPSLRTIDLIHSVDEDWDLVSATRDAAASLDVRVAICEAVRSRLRQEGTPESRIRLIRNGVDLRRFSPRRAGASDGLHRILFAGRLDAVKRPLLVPEIAEALRERRKRDDFRFVIAGDGPERAALGSRVRKRGLEALFDFRGQVPDMAPLLGECELVILPSKAEGIPLIVLEAFASLRTVVASAVGGVPEVVTPETGVPVPYGPQEVRQFADALHELLEQPLLRDALAERGCELVERLFDRQQFADEYRAMFG